MASQSLRKVFEAESSMQASLYCNYLVDEGIHARVSGGDVDLEGRPTIQVMDSDYERARILLTEWESMKRSSNPRPVQFGLLAILVNITVLAMIFAFFRIADEQSNQLLTPMAVFVVFGNLLYLAWHRRRVSN